MGDYGSDSKPQDTMAYSQRGEVFPKMESKKYITPIIIVICLGIGFFGGLKYDAYRAQNINAIKPEEVDLSSFWQAWNLLHDNFFGKSELKTQDLIYGAIEGMVKSADDPYTVFFPPAESKAFTEQIQGSFGGVGVEIGMRNNVLTVIAPIKDSPAYIAGIQSGDSITKIDDKPTDGMDINEAVTLIRGKKGTSVMLSLYRESNNNLFDVKVIRDTIKIPATEWKMLDGNIAYLQVSVFSQNVDQEFQKAAVEISKSSATKIILDLRNNPGGLLDSSVNLAGYFLEEGKTVMIERESGGQETIFKTRHSALLKNYPLVVIINKGSASASEILAGALRDNRNVTIVGETSFGKGSVQDIFDMPQGATVKITIAKWFTPNGNSIDEDGIKPNVEITRSDDDINNGTDSQLDKAMEIIKNL